MLPGWMLGDRDKPEETFTPDELHNLEDMRALIRVGVYYQDYPVGANLDRLRFAKWLVEHGKLNEEVSDA
jgi:hypothetical protein